MAISTYSVTWRLDVKNILDGLADFAGLTPTDGNFIVGDGANWVAESGATVRASLGLGTAAVENIGTSGANVPRLDGTNIWSNKQTLASAQPLFDFDETDGTSTHRISRLTRNGNIFQLHTADSNGIFVSADWRAVVGASGVTSHSWRINNVEKLLLNSSGLTVTDSLTVNGGGNLGNISGLTLASGDIIYANATPALTNLAKGTDGQVLTLASGLPSWAAPAPTAGAAKAWIRFDGTGTAAITDSFNVTSITDNGTGDYTVTFDTDFADANYTWVGNANLSSSATVTYTIKPHTLAAGTFRFTTRRTDTFAATDTDQITIAFFGDQ